MLEKEVINQELDLTICIIFYAIYNNKNTQILKLLYLTITFSNFNNRDSTVKK